MLSRVNPCRFPADCPTNVQLFRRCMSDLNCFLSNQVVMVIVKRFEFDGAGNFCLSGLQTGTNFKACTWAHSVALKSQFDSIFAHFDGKKNRRNPRIYLGVYCSRSNDHSVFYRWPQWELITTTIFDSHAVKIRRFGRTFVPFVGNLYSFFLVDLNESWFRSERFIWSFRRSAIIQNVEKIHTFHQLSTRRDNFLMNMYGRVVQRPRPKAKWNVTRFWFPLTSSPFPLLCQLATEAMEILP